MKRVGLTYNERFRNERKFYPAVLKALAENRHRIIELAKDNDPRLVREIAEQKLNKDKLKGAIEKLWMDIGTTSAERVEDMIRKAKGKSVRIVYGMKKTNGRQQLWNSRMQHYVRERTAWKIEKMITTQLEMINGVIDEVLQKTVEEGLGVIESRKRLVNALMNDEFVMIEKWQARRIVQTEVGQAQNTGSWVAAQENAEGVRKEWLTSGDERVRDSHKEFGRLGPKELDYYYANNLLYPCDPNGDAEEIINCRCVITYNVD